ncbi:hypothetical protein C3L33_14388, partial [Rhododendron williamsianum]
MSSALAPTVINPLSTSNGFLISLPSIFTTKTSPHPCLSIPPKAIKLHLLSLSSHSSFFSLKKKTQSLKLVPFVARTSDWAQQEEDDTAVVDEEEEEEFGWGEGEKVEAVGETDEEGFVGGGQEYQEPNEEAKLFVGNLPWEFDSEKLAQFFDQAGVVEVAELSVLTMWVLLGLESEKSAQFFYQAGVVEVDQVGVVEVAGSLSFMGSLDTFDVGGFWGVGVVEMAEVIYNRETDQSRGFGFVTMSTVEEAEKAAEMFNRYDLNGRFLTVNKASPKGSRAERPSRAFDSPPRDFGPSFKLYVGNLPWDVDNERLEQVFSEHGKVVDARVVYDRESGRSRGFGFVTMSTEAEMNEAVASLDGQVHQTCFLCLGENPSAMLTAAGPWKVIFDRPSAMLSD